MGEVRLAVAEAGDPAGEPVVLLHGFPELSHSWRHQLPALAEAGFHAVAPDLRGYGGSDRPAAVEAYARARWWATSPASSARSGTRAPTSSATTGAGRSPGGWPAAAPRRCAP